MNLVEAELHRRWGHEVIVGRRVMLTKGEGFGGVGGSYDAECASRSLALRRDTRPPFASLARRVFACAQMACSSRTGAAARGRCSPTSVRWRAARRRVWRPAVVFFGMDKPIQFCNSKSSFCNSKSSLRKLGRRCGRARPRGVPLAAHDWVARVGCGLPQVVE